MATKQTNLVVNPSRSLLFCEGEDLVYNYKTSQWSKAPAYDTYGMFYVNSNDQDIGLVVYSSGSVDFQPQTTSGVVQEANLATGAFDPVPGRRAMIRGVRPLHNGGTASVRAGSQNNVSDSTDWATARAVNSRSGVAGFRKEGRYLRVGLTISDNFNHIVGADIDYIDTGQT